MTAGQSVVYHDPLAIARRRLHARLPTATRTDVQHRVRLIDKHSRGVLEFVRAVRGRAKKMALIPVARVLVSERAC